MKRRIFLQAGTGLAVTSAITQITARADVPISGSQDISWMQSLMPNKQIPNEALTKGVWIKLPALKPVAPTIGGQLPGDSWPINAIHMAVLPSGKVLTYGARGDVYAVGVDGQDGSQNVLWDPDTLQFEEYEVRDWLGNKQKVPWQNHDDRPNYNPWEARSKFNSFCSGGTIMPNGKLLMTGGSGGIYWVGNATDASKMTGTYDYVTKKTQKIADNMADGGRWYPTVITLANGKQLVVGGLEPYAEDLMDFDLKAPGLAYLNTVRAPMVYEDGMGWSSLPNISLQQAAQYFELYQSRAEYPRAWVAPGGDVFGISTDRMWFMSADNGGQIGNAGNGVFSNETMALSDWQYDARTGWRQRKPSELPNVGSGSSSAAMFAKGLVLQSGGNGYWVLDGSPASSKATVVDIRNGARNAQTVAQPPMNFPRKFFNMTTLPNGWVFINGGTTQWNALDYQHVRDAEMYIPADTGGTVGRFSLMARQTFTRVYHATSALLPNGTVLSAGGGNPYPVNRNAEIFIPPYFFAKSSNGSPSWALRPAISMITGKKVTHGRQSVPFQVELTDSSSRNSIKSISLVGLSSVTHGFNTGQRRIEIDKDSWRSEFMDNKNRIVISNFPTSDITPPGYYMMFLMNDAGVPSKGIILGVGQQTLDPVST